MQIDEDVWHIHPRGYLYQYRSEGRSIILRPDRSKASDLVCIDYLYYDDLTEYNND